MRLKTPPERSDALAPLPDRVALLGEGAEALLLVLAVVEPIHARELAPADPTADTAAPPMFHQGSTTGISRPRVRAVRRLFQEE